MNEQHLSVLVAGGLGGVFTSVYDKAGWLVAGETPMWTIGQWLGLLVFFGMGAGVVWLFEEPNRKKAFLLGLGLPAFLTVAQTSAGPGSPSVATALLPQIEAFPTAHAQEPTGEEPGEPDSARGQPPSPRTLTITPMDGEPCPEGLLRFYEETRGLGEVSLGGCEEPVEVPAGATHMEIVIPQANPNRFELVDGDGVEYELRAVYSFWNDLRSGLGARNLRAYDVELKPVIRQESRGSRAHP